ncbi:hypothetical protein RJT34_13035 [Clitoria ternatea]|uniref:Acyl-ACP thioesterase-like C-terminal domain-containing protein n=1 Tax=Clitoria ternatea TaxID=43366 RepID=A0AAN9JRD4_CLITE
MSPPLGEVLEIDTWVGASGKNGMQRDWLIRSQATGHIFARATRRSDLDMNQYVNNVKYIRWMLETIPDQILEGHQLSGITLEYIREYGRTYIVQSLCEAEEEEIVNGVAQPNYCTSLLNGLSLATSDIINGNGVLTCLE